jgi:hypothetical protein
MGMRRRNKMLSIESQLSALSDLSSAIGSGTVRHQRGDVVALDMGDRIEVCCVDGSFDIWHKGKPLMPMSLTFDEAVSLFTEVAS